MKKGHSLVPPRQGYERYGFGLRVIISRSLSLNLKQSQEYTENGGVRRQSFLDNKATNSIFIAVYTNNQVLIKALYT